MCNRTGLCLVQENKKSRKNEEISVFFSTGLLLLIALTSCSNRNPKVTNTPGSTDEQSAQKVLLNFLENMHSGRFQEAVKSYGGSYQALIENNTNISSNDYAKLLEAACRINGFQCLEVQTTKLEKGISATEFSFRVEFLNENGTLFIRGPCCGGNATDFPPESSFMFRVTKDKEGNFRVMDLPPYVP
jgi:hypothetical protein